MMKERNSGQYPFESAQQIRMRAVFEKAARQGYYHDAENVDLRKFEERLDRVQTKMKSHLERHTPRWIGIEARRLFQEHRGKLKPTLSPKGILRTETSPAALARKAMNNVEMRNSAKIRKLNQIAIHMRQKLESPDNRLKNKNSPNI